MSDNLKDIFSIFAFNETDCEAISGDGKKFKLHQFILEKNEYFSAILNSPMIEGQTKIINLTENFDILEDIFVYLYSGKIRESKENLFDLFVAANKYLMKNLEYELSEGIIKMLDISNAIQVLLIAEHCNPKLFDSAVNFTIENFEDIRIFNQWQLLTHELKDKLFDKYLEMIKKREKSYQQNSKRYNINLKNMIEECDCECQMITQNIINLPLLPFLSRLHHHYLFGQCLYSFYHLVYFYTSAESQSDDISCIILNKNALKAF